jgi:hypothetical protein
MRCWGILGLLCSLLAGCSSPLGERNATPPSDEHSDAGFDASASDGGELTDAAPSADAPAVYIDGSPGLIDAGLPCDAEFDIDPALIAGLPSSTMSYSSTQPLSNVDITASGPAQATVNPGSVFSDGQSVWSYTFKATFQSQGLYVLEVKADPSATVYGTCQVQVMPNVN